ncbi:uncharacterized protein [Choristoneura fumiferana]|uniref:uncharacterized protein n=1 Tax=Choristoneura fumiferana TaxID=7141 RepID=UPI003D15F190
MSQIFCSRLYYYNTMFLPSVISGLALYLEPMVRRIPVTNLFANLVFEYWIRTLHMEGFLRRTPGKETILFMIGSAVFFYLLRKERDNEKRTPLFWIFTPPRVSKEVCEPLMGDSLR